MAFDKTGTLTRGRLAILEMHPLATLNGDHLLQLAAAAEHQLRHPVARALVRHAESRGLVLAPSGEVDFTIGMGVRAQVGRHHVRVGSERYLRLAGIPTSGAGSYLSEVERHGHSVLLVAVDESLAGAIAYADELRPEALGLMAALRHRSIRELVMLTGDRGSIARRIAEKLGIRRFFAEALPAHKAEIMDSLRQGGGPFAMVGDGVNDSPALARADVGIALVEGADIARDAADVVLMEDGLLRIVDAIDISRGAMNLVRQNYTLIAVCNTLALGLALPTGWVSPAAITLLSNGSAIAASLNAMRPLLHMSGRRL
jgi:Cu2+-exporting ATPase